MYRNHFSWSGLLLFQFRAQSTSIRCTSNHQNIWNFLPCVATGHWQPPLQLKLKSEICKAYAEIEHEVDRWRRRAYSFMLLFLELTKLGEMPERQLKNEIRFHSSEAAALFIFALRPKMSPMRLRFGRRSWHCLSSLEQAGRAPNI